MTERIRLRYCLAGAGLWLVLSTGIVHAQPLPAQGSVEVAFSPQEDPEALIISAITEAKKTVQVQVYLFTSQKIARALVDVRKKGVLVQVLLDKKMNGRKAGKAIRLMLEGGVALAFSSEEYSAAHNKVIIIDGKGPGCTVVTGSYNFTWSARHVNAENVLILRNNCTLAKRYEQNWLLHRKAAQTIDSLAVFGR